MPPKTQRARKASETYIVHLHKKTKARKEEEKNPIDRLLDKLRNRKSD